MGHKIQTFIVYILFEGLGPIYCLWEAFDREYKTGHKSNDVESHELTTISGVKKATKKTKKHKKQKETYQIFNYFPLR